MDCYEYSSAIPTIRAALVAGVVGLAQGPLTPASSQKENVGQGRPQGGRRGARGSRLTPRAVGDGRTAVPLQAGLAREKAVGNVGAPRPSVTTDGTRAS